MSIERWLGRLGDVHPTGDMEDLRVDCPFCRAKIGREDTGAHLYVSQVSPVAHCFRCSWAGHWVTLIISVEGCSYGDALRYIETPPVDITRFGRLHSPRGLYNTEELLEQPAGYEPLIWVKSIGPCCDGSVELKAVWRYARSRWKGITRERVLEFLHAGCFGWIEGTHRLWIMIDAHWWQGRSIIGTMPKYLSPPWPKGNSLWNGGALERYDDIIICEGVFSAIHAGPNAIALCGKAIIPEQATRIAKADLDSITLMLDADAYDEAIDSAIRLEEAGFDGALHIHRLYKGDPADGLDGEVNRWSYKQRVMHVLNYV